MLANFDFKSVIRTMVRSNSGLTEQSAIDLLDAYLQWVSIIPAVSSGNCVAMLDTEVELACHAFILNTRLYKDFCDRFLGFFLHHDPVEDGTTIDDAEIATRTAALLKEHFGSQLNPAFDKWLVQIGEGSFQLACKGFCR